MTPLTDRQRQILEFCIRHFEEHGAMPTIREIALAVGIASTNGVSEHLNRLAKKGYLERANPSERSTGQGAKPGQLNRIGRILRLPDGTRVRPMLVPKNHIATEVLRDLIFDLVRRSA